MSPHVSIDRQRLATLCQRWGIIELSLFGSVLTERFGPQSDIDVLVVFAPQAPIGFLELAAIQEDLSALFGRDVDVVPKDGLKPLIRRQVLHDSQVVYAA